MAITRIDIANQALVELAAAPIGTLEERSLEAREAARVIDQVIGELLEGPHDWSWQIRRANLVEIALNRPGEWAKAYAAPSDIAKPLGVMPVYAGLASGTVVWPSTASRPAIPYLLEGGTIYSSLNPASFAYVSKNLDYTRASKKFGRAVSLEMAVRMAIPLKKSRDMKGDLIKQARVALEQAIADDFNNSPHYTPDYVTDTELVRGGGFNIDAILDAPWRRGH